MKKRILTLVMVLVLMIAVSVVGVSADDVAPQAETGKQMWSHLTDNGDGTATGYCPHCGDDTSVMQTWTKLTLSATGSSISVTASGHYFLDADYEGKAAINLGAEDVDVVLHLNGHTYKRAGNDGGSGALCTAKSNTTVSIVDDQDQKGTIHGSGGWAVYDYGAPSSNYTTNTEVNLYSGNLTSQVTTIPSGSSNSNGGTVCMTSGTFNMFGGTINGTKATYGGAIYTKAGKAQGSFAKVNIHGGTINGGEVQRGGAIYADGGAQVTISGGTINGGKATYGGALYITSGAQVTISDGTVTGGQATSRGGNIYMASKTCTLNVSGGTIKNGVAQDDGSEITGGGNVYTNHGVFNLTGGTISGGKGVRGGNIYTNTTIEEDTYPNNTTTIHGTAVIKGGKATYGGNLCVSEDLTLGAVTFQNGKGTYGTDIYMGSSAQIKVTEDYNGSAKVYCGAGYLSDTVLGSTMTERRISSTGVFDGKLYLENEAGAPLLYANGDGLLHIANVALMGNNGKYTWYASNADAVTAYNANTVYMQATSGALALNGGDYVVDLAGNNVTITGSGNVTIFDSANDDYTTYGTATINGPVLKNDFQTTVAGKDTYKVERGTNQYSFHRVGAEIVSANLRPNVAGMYYEGAWQCDALLADKVQTFGVAVSLKDQPGKDFATDKDTLYTAFSKAAFGNNQADTSTLIEQIVKDGEGDKNTVRSKQKIYATAYIVFEDGSIAISEQKVGYSLYNALKDAETNLYQYRNDADALKEFDETWTAAGARWELDFDLSEDEKYLLNVYGDRVAYHGEAHDHSSVGDGKSTLTQWKKGLKSLNMDFASILDHQTTAHMTDAAWDSTKFIGGTEASTKVDGEDTKKMHYSMVFTDPNSLNEVVETLTLWGIFDRFNLFNYPDLSVSQIQTVIQAVKDEGGMFVHVHPKESGYIDSDDPLDYYFADWTGLEVHYGIGGYAPTQDVSKKNYDLWVDLLKLGKKVWATAGSDSHADAGTNALTTLFATAADNNAYLDCMKSGNATCGPVGIRMCVGNTMMGGQADFAGQKVIFSVGDFHESAYDPSHTYSVKLYKGASGAEEVVYTDTFKASKPFCDSVEADDTASYYRVEVWDDTADYALPIAIGNPIWNN